MVKTTDGDGNPVAPFLTKCYEMVEDELTNAIISWTSSNDSFVIWKMTEFSRDLLPKYFKHSNFSSFMRQLNIYGFRKIDSDRWEFANEGFAKGQKHSLTNISRRKYSQSLVQGKSSRKKEKSSEKSEEIEEFSLLWKEVESLKTGKIALTQELVKIEQNQETEQNKLLLLGDRLQGMEKNQQQMLSFLVMAMQNPGVLVQLLQPKENSWRRAETGKRMLEEAEEDCEKVASDGMLVRYQPPIDEAPKPVLKSIPSSDKSPEVEFSSDALKDLFLNMDFTNVPMEHKLLSSENHSPVTLPDFLDDSILEQLLLATSMLDSTEEGNSDHEEPEDAAMEMDLSVKPLTDEMEKAKIFEMGSTGFGTRFENSQKLEILTEKMGHLASDNTININNRAEEI